MNQKTGLVLEGGAMRGLFSAGVLDVMMENGIEFDAAMGVSAGAVFGCNFKSGQIGRSIRYNMRFCDDPRYCSLESLRKTGDLYGVQFCYDEIPNKLDPFDKEAYRSNPMPFYAVCTNVETGKAIHKRLDNGDAKDMEYFRASASMPVVSRIVEVDGYKLLDGGITDSIPLASMERRHHRQHPAREHGAPRLQKKRRGAHSASRLCEEEKQDDPSDPPDDASVSQCDQGYGSTPHPLQ